MESSTFFPVFFFFFQAEDGIRDGRVTGVQTCALPISISDAGNVSIVRGSFNIQTGGSTSISTGVGVIHMSTANPATNASWIPIAYAGTKIGRASCRERV